jgi:hypothetical protein
MAARHEPRDAPAAPAPAALHGAISRVTPTSVSAWLWCPRRYYLRYVLGLPESDAGASTDEGKRVHAVLRQVHLQGGCHDAASVHDVLVANGCDTDAMRSLIDQHRSRCPREVDEGQHDIARARYHHLPPPYFLATAELDAVWVHDGLFDIRDYKTGGSAPLELRDDERAKVQAWVWAPLAAKKRLRLRIRYEYLAAEVDEPAPWEPDDDDLAGIESWLTALVADMRSSDYEGVADERHCRACGFRSICTDSAAPGEPVWPVLGASITDPEP